MTLFSDKYLYITLGSTMSTFLGAQSRFRLFSPSGYNIPKPKMMYFVNFVTNQLNNTTLKHLSFFVKRMDRLQMSYDVQEMNQYNKKRLIQGKLQYGPLNFSLHDTIDGTAFKMVEAYNRFYFGDFTNKTDSSWNYDVIGSSFEQSAGWGLKGNRTPNSGNFFSRIEVYEMYDQVYSQIDFINPRFVGVDMQPLDIADSAGNEVNINAKYEGVIFKAIAQPITSELANRFGLPLHNDLPMSLSGGFNIPGFDMTGDSFLSNIQSALNGEIPSPIFNSVNSALNGIIPSSITDSTLFQTLNGLFGDNIGGGVPSFLSIDPLNTTASSLPWLQNNINAGNSVTDVATADFDISDGFGWDLGF